MVKAVIFIVVLALVLQILNYVVLTSLYGIQLNLMVKSVGNKKQNIVSYVLYCNCVTTWCGLCSNR